MTDVFVGVLLALTAVSLGLRAVNLLIPGVHPLARLIMAGVIGTAITTATLRVSDSYGVHDLGLGLLVSLSPVGIFDIVKWWYRWKK
jgi:hypothetical protein